MNFIQPWLYLFLYVVAAVYFAQHIRDFKKFMACFPGDVGIMQFAFLLGVPVTIAVLLFVGGQAATIIAFELFWFGFLAHLGKVQDPELIRCIIAEYQKES